MPTVTTHSLVGRNLLLLPTVFLFGCVPTVPLYDSVTGTTGHQYCADFLRYTHACVSSTTFLYLFCLCVAVVLGFLAAQLNNDPNGATTFAKHRSSFLFVVAAVAGILGAYFHSRADAASVAAADIEAALTARKDFKKYQMCLVAASKWDGSRSEALDAANAMASDKNSSGTAQLTDAMEASEGARSKALEAIDKSNRAVQSLLQLFEQNQSPQRRQGQAQPRGTQVQDSLKLTQVQDRLKEAQQALDQAKVRAESTQGIVAQIKRNLTAVEDVPAAPPSKPVQPAPARAGTQDADPPTGR
jgi:hypothetical protein